MLDKFGISTVQIEDHRMMMIRHCTREQHRDLVSLCRLDQTVRKGIIGIAIRPQQELALSTPACDQVELAGEHLPRERHPCRYTNNRASSGLADSAGLQTHLAES